MTKFKKGSTYKLRHIEGNPEVEVVGDVIDADVDDFVAEGMQVLVQSNDFPVPFFVDTRNLESATA